MGQLDLWLGDGHGALRSVTATALEAAGRLEGGWIRKSFAGDFNGDGLLDFVATGYGRPCPELLFLNQGGARFERVDLPTKGCEFLVPLDAEGDGRLDLVALEYGLGMRPVLLRNRGF